MSKVISVIEVVKAIQRIPREYQAQSFFGKYDLWLYVAVYDEKLCERCQAHARKQVFRGTELRSTFRYLKIEDENLIYANVHPHCRCFLYRIISLERYLRMLEMIEEREAKR